MTELESALSNRILSHILNPIQYHIPDHISTTSKYDLNVKHLTLLAYLKKTTAKF